LPDQRPTTRDLPTPLGYGPSKALLRTRFGSEPGIFNDAASPLSPASLATRGPGSPADPHRLRDQRAYREASERGRGHIEIVYSLLAAGAKVDAVNASGQSPLLLAAQNDRAEVVELLLSAGADVNLADQNQVVPIAMASKNGLGRIVSRLLSAGAEVNVPRLSDGVTPLHRAAMRGHREVVELLLEANADPQAVTAAGSTPLELATRNGNADIIELLQAKRR